MFAFEIVGAIVSLASGVVSAYVGAKHLRAYRRRSGDQSKIGRVLSGEFVEHHRKAA